MHPLLRLCCVLLVACVGMLGVLALLQRKLIYMPSRESESALLAGATRIGLAPWRDASGAVIGWRRPPLAGVRAANRLLVLHGNAGFALHRVPYLECLEALDEGRSWEVYLFEYPGYGARDGSPGEGEITRAALAALDLLAASDDRPIHLLGESVGSGPACALARARPQGVAGMFLVTPFNNLRDVAAYHYPMMPVRLLLRERWDNVAALQGDRTHRLAMLLAGRDEVVPNRFGQILYDSYSGPKRLWIQATAMHNTLDLSPGAPWWREVSAFLLNAENSQR